MPGPAKSFFWYELMTTDPKAAEAFYTKVVGWNAEPWGAPGAASYIVVKAGDRGVGGLMDMPEQYRQDGGKPAWIGYIHAADADKATERVRQAGGKVHREPSDIPDVGRFSVVADPQGAAFMLLAPNGPDQPSVPAGTPGHVGWHDLYTTGWQAAFDFYSGQFGWTKDQAVDMGPMGTYQIFAVGGAQTGGMMDKSDAAAPNGWLFYFNVPRIEAAAKRVADNGGRLQMEPMEVPGGQWVAQCFDPQGARFAMVAPAR